MTDYAAAREGAAVIELPERAVLAATGPQRQKFLHNMLSNTVEGLQPGQGCLAALMDVKGHLLALMRALVTKDAVLLEMPQERLARVEETLLFYRVAAPVRFAALPTAILALIGPRVKAVLEGLGVAPPAGAQGHVEASLAGQAVRVVRATDLPADGHVVHVLPEHVVAVREALLAAGAAALSRETLDVLRVEDGRPWYGPDVTEDNLLHETGLLGEYHSATKGCYVGQEVVARLEGRGGNVNKLLRGLRLGGPAHAGAPVLREGREVGRVTTSGVSPRSGPIALAYVQRGAFEPGTGLEVEGRPASVVALPFALGAPA
jgi:folate-binding protein YgfZ